MGTSIIADKTYHFSQRIIKCSRFLKSQHKEYVISKQLLKSGTSIGANVIECEYAQSNKDFLHKMDIALKEAAETEFWLKQIKESSLYGDHWDTLLSECIEINKILNSIVKTTRNNLNSKE